MRTIHTLEEVTSLDLTIFAINSHIKAYSLCWHINKTLGINLKKNKGAFVSEKEVFSCFEFTLEEQKTILLTLFCIAALNTAVEPATIFLLIR